MIAPAPAGDLVRLAVPGDDEPRVSVVVVGWRDAPHLRACLRALARHAAAHRFEVVVALNEPTDGLEQGLRAAFPWVRWYSSRVNLGFAGAANLAARHASGEYLAFLNDDARPERGWIDGLVDAAERRPAAAAVGGLVRFVDGSLQEAGSVVWRDGWTSGVGRGLRRDDTRWRFERRVDYASASCLLVRRGAFERVGGFDEGYYPAYFEDVDLCLRLAADGGETWFTPFAAVRHLESQSTSAPYRAYLMELNHARFAARFADQLASRLERRASPAGIDEAVLAATGARWRVLVIDDRTPNAAAGSGLGRMGDVVSELATDGDFLVTFFPGVERGAGDPGPLARQGVEQVSCDLTRYRGRLPAAIADHLASRTHAYDALVVSRPHNYERYGWALRGELPGVPLIYDAEAVYSRRLARRLPFAGDLVERLARNDELAEMQRLEAAIASDSDYLVCISEPEADFFRSRTQRPVLVNPPLLAGAHPTPGGFAERRELVFVAGWAAGSDSPNADGLLWFVREVLGAVRARVPGTRILVTGAHPPRNVRRLRSPALRLLGEVADLSQLYQRTRVAVVPLRYGAGVTLKAVEALQHGVPVVTTSVGADGIPLDDASTLTVADDPAAFADEVVALLTDEERWRAQRRAIEAQLASWTAGGSHRIWASLVRRAVSAPLPARRPA